MFRILLVALLLTVVPSLALAEEEDEFEPMVGDEQEAPVKEKEPVVEAPTGEPAQASERAPKPAVSRRPPSDIRNNPRAAHYDDAPSEEIESRPVQPLPEAEKSIRAEVNHPDTREEREIARREAHERFLDTVNRHCFVFDDPRKFPEGVRMMANCTALLKKAGNQEGLAWSLTWFARNANGVEDGRCFRKGKAYERVGLEVTKSEILRKGVENKCHLLFIDLKDRCGKKGRLAPGSVLQAQWFDLCTEKGKISRPVQVRADALTCSMTGAFLTAGEMRASSAKGPPLAEDVPKGKAASKGGAGRAVKASTPLALALGMNQSNRDVPLVFAVKGEAQIMERMMREQIAIIPMATPGASDDPSLCTNVQKNSKPAPRAPAARKSSRLPPAKKQEAKKKADPKRSAASARKKSKKTH